jgi:hypothetical protein
MISGTRRQDSVRRSNDACSSGLETDVT